MDDRGHGTLGIDDDLLDLSSNSSRIVEGIEYVAIPITDEVLQRLVVAEHDGNVRRMVASYRPSFIADDILDMHIGKPKDPILQEQPEADYVIILEVARGWEIVRRFISEHMPCLPDVSFAQVKDPFKISIYCDFCDEGKTIERRALKLEGVQ